jgi:hypothetical protein
MTKLKSARTNEDGGSALLIALLASSLLAALGLALAGLGSVETVIASNQRAGSQLAYAAEATAEGVLADLLTTSNWTDVLNGVVLSRLSGHAVPPVGPGDPPMTLAQLTAVVQAENDTLGFWGANSPQWRLFAHGWITELAPMASVDHDEFLTAFAADDVAETDGDPFADTNGRIQIAARASSARGAHRTILMTVAQTTKPTPAGFPGVRILAWKEIR